MRKLGVTTAHRKSMLKNLVTDLIINEKITTTYARAKETQKLVEKIITYGKNDSNNSRKKVLKYIFIKKDNKNNINSYNKLFDIISPRYNKRNGGYTRIIKKAPRKGDGALEVLLELV